MWEINEIVSFLVKNTYDWPRDFLDHRCADLLVPFVLVVGVVILKKRNIFFTITFLREPICCTDCRQLTQAPLLILLHLLNDRSHWFLLLRLNMYHLRLRLRSRFGDLHGLRSIK